MPASARDQIESFNQMQQYRRILPVHPPLAETLNHLLDPQQTSVLMAPDDSVSILIEDLPRTLVTGGRGAGNRARWGDNRFFNQVGSRAPWLDSEDLVYMAQYDVTHIVNRPDNTRFAQMRLQPTQFDLIGETPGYNIFTWNAGGEADEIDRLYTEMNALYSEIELPRWGPEGFALVRTRRPGHLAAHRRPVGPPCWHKMPMMTAPRLGLAYSTMMMGADDQALPLWQRLHDNYPDVALFTDALAYSEHILGQPMQGVQVAAGRALQRHRRDPRTGGADIA